MLEFKETLKNGIIKKFDILIIGIRKSQKPNRNIIKKNQKMRKLIIMGLFNPGFITQLQDILRTKRFMRALYNIPFQFELR